MKAGSSMDVISLAVRSILFSLSGRRRERKEKKTNIHPPLQTHLLKHSDIQTFRLTHGGEVGLVDLGDSVVAGVEVCGVFGQWWYTVQLQIIAVDRTTEARAQQTGGHTWEI